MRLFVGRKRLFVGRKTNRTHHDYRGHDIGRSMSLSLVNINGTISFRAPKNIVLDTKIIILSGLFKTNDQKCILNEKKRKKKTTHVLSYAQHTCQRIARIALHAQNIDTRQTHVPLAQNSMNKQTLIHKNTL